MDDLGGIFVNTLIFSTIGANLHRNLFRRREEYINPPNGSTVSLTNVGRIEYTLSNTPPSIKLLLKLQAATESPYRNTLSRGTECVRNILCIVISFFLQIVFGVLPTALLYIALARDTTLSHAPISHLSST